MQCIESANVFYDANNVSMLAFHRSKHIQPSSRFLHYIVYVFIPFHIILNNKSNRRADFLFQPECLRIPKLETVASLL